MPGERFAAVREGPRFLFYSHDGVGLGHIRRSLASARALSRARERASIVLATSAEYADALGPAASLDILTHSALDFDGARRAARNLLELAYVRSPGRSRLSGRALTTGP